MKPPRVAVKQMVRKGPSPRADGAEAFFDSGSWLGSACGATGARLGSEKSIRANTQVAMSRTAPVRPKVARQPTRSESNAVIRGAKAMPVFP